VRREEILEAAMTEFAHGGLHGTSTEAIAARAGISQPYLFRLFGTKKELFIASSRRCFGRVLAAFQEAAGGKRGAAAMRAMGNAHAQLLADRRPAHRPDADVRRVLGSRRARRSGELFRYVESVSGASTAEIRDFFARGMLMNMAAAIDLPQICGEDHKWAHELRVAK
jgi:AcrR family transcriptional regulator